MKEHTSADELSDRELTHALDRLARGFESEDPHIRYEAKMVAKQNFQQLAKEIQ